MSCTLLVVSDRDRVIARARSACEAAGWAEPKVVRQPLALEREGHADLLVVDVVAAVRHVKFREAVRAFSTRVPDAQVMLVLSEGHETAPRAWAEAFLLERELPQDCEVTPALALDDPAYWAEQLSGVNRRHEELKESLREHFMDAAVRVLRERQDVARQLEPPSMALLITMLESVPYTQTVKEVSQRVLKDGDAPSFNAARMRQYRAWRQLFGKRGFTTKDALLLFKVLWYKHLQAEGLTLDETLRFLHLDRKNFSAQTSRRLGMALSRIDQLSYEQTCEWVARVCLTEFTEPPGPERFRELAWRPGHATGSQTAITPIKRRTKKALREAA